MNEPLKAGNIGWSPDYKGSVEEKLESLRVYPIRRAPDPLLWLVRELRDALEQAGRSLDNADIPWPWDKSLFVRADAALAKESESSIRRGLSQEATIDRGSFAQYATETITTSEATKAALAEAPKAEEGKGA